MIGLFQKNPNSGDLQHTYFLKKYGSGSFRFFRFVTLPLKILEKKAFFTLGNSVKLCYTPRSKTKTHEILKKLYS